ncbi:zinc-ribbon domain-containing protein [Nostoc sp. UCD121]|uniref:tubulin-like doman-containing protein n=1 Tax=unclassified Nostoc TaxID=2593658 RepID=UPI001625B2D3|nr:MULTISPECIES: tubulin-like doman-containing protein [unclassified Nostoc]MBC1224175.1 zinc-ribbon domain-containing protein [Nostoc sp. UCD120]MBC1279586.1 zinc-ribbon domain-containing protein [Nostoc sp. UCD121]MBC1296898.1 zinc-ribbon domain-containing protein [Nostoc sp. UCD122]
MPVAEKTMVPTVLVGVGGTGNEVLSRVRRLVEETYGNLKNFPLLSFLIIDTDREYKVTNPGASGSPFEDYEKYWASVKGSDVQKIISEMDNYPWIESWFPSELERNIGAIEAGAGQIRAYGRFAFFCNYHRIQRKFYDICNYVKGHEEFMQNKHGVQVDTNAFNVFIVGSLSGGTGSGMLLDIGYCIRHWLRGQGTSTVNAIVPMPNAFASIDVGDRVLANGYAALMELSYFSDHRTEYVTQFSSQLTDEIRSKSAPFDFTYLVGTKNGESDFNLDQMREMMAQNIFLDLTSDFAPHKRSIRDNIKGAWAQADPGGRSYPKNFMSFGLSTIEIPIAQIRTSLSQRLASDFVSWWLNESVSLPPDMTKLVETDILKGMRLTAAELLSDLSSGGERSLTAEVSAWVNSIRNETTTDNKLKCTYEYLNLIGPERGKILKFLDYLQPKVNEYRDNHFRELSPDTRSHGDFFIKMYDNQKRIIQWGRKALEEEFYRIIEDRNRGLKFADAFITAVSQTLTTAETNFRREVEKVWQPNETNRQQQYENALQDISQFKDKFALTKQDDMEKRCDLALIGLEGSLVAMIQRKARALGWELIARLQEHLDELNRRLARLNQKLRQSRDYFQQKANQQADSADALIINGIKLYDRQELNQLYQDMIEQLAGASAGSKTRYELGMDGVCSNVSQQVLLDASPLWKRERNADEVMRLFDVQNLADVQDNDFKDIIADKTQAVVVNAPENSRLKRELTACDRLFKVFNNEETEIRNRIGIAYNKSKPLILLSDAVLKGQDAGFDPKINYTAAIVGGRNSSDPAAIKLIPMLRERVGNNDSITPLGNAECHRIVFVQEIGGFSLRCVVGMLNLQESYQDWKGQSIEAKRAQLRGESKDSPIPVHIQKEPPFWDVFPEKPEIFKLIVEARALKVLQLDQNRQAKENVIRYTRKTVTGAENVDIASSWEEAVQVLQIKACRFDKEEIQRQVTAELSKADTSEKKQTLFQHLLHYLKLREFDLEQEGGKDSNNYKRENKIIQDLITKYMPDSESNEVQSSDKSAVFCTQCGQNNPANSNFCSNCGHKLI